MQSSGVKEAKNIEEYIVRMKGLGLFYHLSAVDSAANEDFFIHKRDITQHRSAMAQFWPKVLPTFFKFKLKISNLNFYLITTDFIDLFLFFSFYNLNKFEELK